MLIILKKALLLMKEAFISWNKQFYKQRKFNESDLDHT